MRVAASRERDRTTYEWLFAQSRAQHGRIAALSLLCTVQAAVLVGFALACRSVIDRAVTGDVDGLLLAAAALAGIIVAQLALRLAINGMLERIRARLALELRKTMLEDVFAARYSSVVRFHSGELSNRMFSDVQVVSSGVATIIPSFVSMFTQLLFAIAVLALISPPMVALFAAAALVSFVLARALRGRLKALHKTVQEKEGAVRVFCKKRSNTSWSSARSVPSLRWARGQMRCRKTTSTRRCAAAGTRLPQTRASRFSSTPCTSWRSRGARSSSWAVS